MPPPPGYAGSPQFSMAELADAGDALAAAATPWTEQRADTLHASGARAVTRPLFHRTTSCCVLTVHASVVFRPKASIAPLPVFISFFLTLGMADLHYAGPCPLHAGACLRLVSWGTLRCARQCAQ